MRQANPTTKTQKQIVKVLRANDKDTLLTLSSIALMTSKSIYQVKASIQFLKELGVVETVISRGGTTFVKLRGKTNAD